MAATELATAYLSLVPSMRGAQGAIARELGSVDADGIGRNIGGRMGGGISGALQGLVGPALAALAAIGLGGYIKEAAAASDATDKFKGTLNFAGLGADAVAEATKAAKGYADETVYELSDIQATMAQLAANGVKDYTGITQAAGNLNAVAGGNAETFKSVSRAVTQSAGAGKLMTEDWNMLADAIPGASGQLQKAMREAGAFEGNFKEAMEAGEISAEEFQTAITKLGSTPIASEAARSVTTFEGALGNLNATINSGLMGALDALKPMITGAINGVAAGLGAMFGWFGAMFSGLRSLIMDGDITGDLLGALGLEEDSPIIGAMMTLQEKFWSMLSGIRATFSGLRSLIMDGDISGELLGALGLEEDSPVIGAMMTLQEKFWSMMRGIRDFVTGFTFPPVFDPESMGFTGMAAIGATVRGVFTEIGAAVSPLVPYMLDLWSAVSPVSTIFAALQPNIGPLVGLLGSLATVIGGSLASVISGILPSIQTLQGVFIGLFMDVLAVAIPLVAQLVGMLAGTLATLIPVLVPIIVQVASLAAALAAQLAPIFMSLVSAVLPMVVSVLGAVLGAVVPLVSEIAGFLIPVIQSLLPVVVTVFGVAASVIQSAMQVIQGIIQVVTGIISGNWSQVFQGLGNIVSGAFSLIVSVIGGALGIIGSVVMAGLALVGNVFSSTFNAVMGFLGGVWGNILSGASGMVGGLLGFFSGLPGRIMGALGNFGSLLVGVGRDMIQGLINGISGMMGAIGRAVINIVPEAIRGPFQDLLGIRSPSTVFREYGHNIGQGLVLGLADMYGAVAAATEGLAHVPAVPGFASASSMATYGDYARPGDTGAGGPQVVQNIYPAEKMSEENLANVSARKITGALV